MMIRIRNVHLFMLVLSLMLVACGPGNQSDSSPTSSTEGAGNSVTVKDGSPDANENSIIDRMNINQKLFTGLVERGINEIRTSKGLKPLTTDKNLTSAAKSQNDIQVIKGVLNQNLAVTEQGSVLQRINSFGGKFQIVGENVQYLPFPVQLLEGKHTVLSPEYKKAATDIVNKWVNSEDHYKIFTSDLFTNMGTSIGWNEETIGLFVTQIYGG